ncbi:MAG: molybdopterin-dependent oxidoreductase [Myxococcota bacterium]|nr:molybdopterin-dependent oxidoreductase [Myxococcota bacterium]
MPTSISRVRARPIDRRRALELMALGALAAAAGCGGADTSADLVGGRRDDDDQPDLEALPPISSNDDFYVLWFLGSPGDVDASTWSCTVHDEEDALGSFDLALLSSLPAEDREHTLQCVESRPDFLAMDNAIWQGTSLRNVLRAAGIDPPEERAWIVFTCADTYGVALPAGDLDGAPLFLAWGMNGEALPLDHGFPARVLTPGRYGWLNPKQITAIRFTDSAYEPPWMASLMTQYAAQGIRFDPVGSMEYQPQVLVVQPSAMDVVGDRVRVLGKAYAGDDPIISVEVSTDGGRTWAEAELTYAPGRDVWALWRFHWTPERLGTHVLVTRATTASGRSCTPDLDPMRSPWPGGMAIEVEVS